MSIFLKIIFLLLFTHSSLHIYAWGFYAHQRINRQAIFTLPPAMFGFYKHHVAYITEKSVNPDKRRYAVVGEAPKHFIDLDIYGDSAKYTLPQKWHEACERYTEDNLKEYGINPWHIVQMKYRLTQAFLARDAAAILFLSADLGHYVADGNVPLHTTSNYNGQKTAQHGIHGFWESRLPELFADKYDLLTGRAEYITDPVKYVWKATYRAHQALDSVFYFEKALSAQLSEDQKHALEDKDMISLRVYSRKMAKMYHQALNGQVERQMRSSIKMIGNLWYSAWIDAGSPDLNSIQKGNLEDEQFPDQKGPAKGRLELGFEKMFWRKKSEQHCCLHEHQVRACAKTQ